MKKKIVSWILGLLIIIWIGGSFYVRSKAPGSIFIPEQIARSRQLTDFSFAYSRDLVTNKAGQKIEIITVPNNNSKNVILYFHGNAGRVTDILQKASSIATVVSPAYPGYGESEGNPTEANFYETADLTMKYLLNKGYSQNQIIILGHSLGGADAVYTAEKYPQVQKLILVNTFDSVFSFCWPKFNILCTFTYNYLNSDQLAHHLTVPTREFHDLADAVIPYSQGQELFKAVSSPDKKFETIPGTHSSFDVLHVLQSE